MATINANTVAVYIDDAAGTITTNPGETQGASPALIPVMYSTSASIQVNNATFEVNYKATTAATSGSAPSLAPTRAFGVGTTTASISIEGVASWATLADCVDLDALFDHCVGKGKVSVVWSSTDTAGTAFGGQGYFTSFDLSSGVDDFATYSATIELVGDPVSVA